MAASDGATRRHPPTIRRGLIPPLEGFTINSTLNRPTSTAPAPWFIAGPTAVGKSAVALELAERIGGEVISVDSMQVYRGLDIGTAKPTPDERRRAPHHLIDVAEVTSGFDAAQFVRLAAAAVAEIRGRGRTPIFCGGTGLYFQAYFEGLGAAPPMDAALRAELEAAPAPQLWAELEAADPDCFKQIDLHNRRRVVRALEVIRLTGRPFSAQRASWSPGSPPAPAAGTGEPGERCDPGEPGSAPMLEAEAAHGAPVAREVETAGLAADETRLAFCLTRARDDLHARIARRVEEMFARGLTDETARLLAAGLAGNRTALQAIGYRQVAEHLRGEHSLAETIELVKSRTRQFAKRQLTWFLRRGDWTWLELGAHEPAGATVDRLLTGRARAER